MSRPYIIAPTAQRNISQIYDPMAKPLEILRIIHGARDLEKAFSEDE
jgi:plasmid stabilization system protein ParE